MRYIFLIYGDENCWTEQERHDCMIESKRISDELRSQGKLIDSSPLFPVAAATSLRIRDGQRQLIDGPFAETTEQLGGYYLVDVDHLDEAIAIATRLPPAKKGTVEIRPILDIPEPELATSRSNADTPN